MPAEDMMLRPASQMQVAQPFSMGPNMHPAVGSTTIPFHQHPNLHHAVAVENFGANGSFTDADSQMMDREDGEEMESVVPQARSKNGSSRTSANNELEMRQLFQSNQHRTLKDVAKELHGNERGPNSERARQIFAMLWINQVCTRGRTSVPRGRVYTNYATRCATERITVLNPASFGKLVRVLYPGLKTRRLGVRGESKYHYVNFAMIDDQPELREPSIQPALPLADPTPFAQSFSAGPSQSPALNPQGSTAQSPVLVQQANTHVGSRLAGNHAVYHQPDVPSLKELHSSNAKTLLRLDFLEEAEEPTRSPPTVVLPDIKPFLPKKTDPDSAASLVACYQAYCNVIIEAIRFVKEQTFYFQYRSFTGTLTAPVLKLFRHPSIAPWIQECEFALYQTLMRILSVLALQVVPAAVLDALRNIAEHMVPCVREHFGGEPEHVVQAKEASAAVFAALLDRLLRVNLTAHAAANMLSNAENRDTMYIDWLTIVRIRKVAECVPLRGMDDVVDILLGEIRDLINPVRVPWEIESMTLYGEVARGGRDTQASDSTDDQAPVLDRWTNFLRSIPTRFPYASPAEIVDCVHRVGNEVMRDITVGQGKSFGSWWVTKCWIDEMIAFLAEYGGFMKTKNLSPPTTNVPNVPQLPGTNGETSQQRSRLSSGSEDLDISRIPQPQPDRAPFPSQAEANGQDDLLQPSQSHDDSGIGIRTPEEDFPVDKYDFQHTPEEQLQPQA